MKRLVALGLLVTALAVCTETAAAALCDCQSCVVTGYFHTNVRCATCRTIEAYTREALATAEETAPQARFVVINTDEIANRHYMKDFGLYTKSVIVALVKDGKVVKFENLQKIWELTGNKEAFIAYVREAVARYAEEL